jgi:hypothetical protein
MQHRSARRLFAALRRDTGAVTIIEFALTLPLLLLMAFGGLEIANLAVVHTRVNQIAISLADNASRMKQETVGGAPKIREFDVNQAFAAATQQGIDLRLGANGRLILSSLTTNAAGGQWIQWQRCSGTRTAYVSSYGVQDSGKTGTAFPGMGPTGNVVTAEAGSAVMVAEIIYDYQPLILDRVFDSSVIRKYSAMYVRDDRDLSGTGISNTSPAATASTC